jgi:hypothetical protein
MEGNAMRRAPLACLLAAATIATAGCGPKRRSEAVTPANHSPSSAASGKSGESGVYGFSGARVAEGAPEGVIGECIWIFDESDHTQIAKGECGEAEPGKFRIALKPGKYVVHGPGGKQRIEVKRGTWLKVMSLVELPLAP